MQLEKKDLDQRALSNELDKERAAHARNRADSAEKDIEFTRLLQVQHARYD